MRVLIFYDSRHQTEAARVLARALETDLDAQVVFGGPGCTESYFGITLPRFQKQERGVGFWKIDLAGIKRDISSIWIGLTTYLRPIQSAPTIMRSHLRRLVRRIRIIIRRRLGYKRFRYSSFRRFLAVKETVCVEDNELDTGVSQFRQALQNARRIVSAAVERGRPRYWVQQGRIIKRSYQIGTVAYLSRMPAIGPGEYVKNIHRIVLSGLEKVRYDHGLTGMFVVILAAPLLALGSVLGFDIIRSIREYKALLNQAMSAVEDADVDVLIVMEDNAEGLTGIITHAARRSHIPFIIVPDYIPNPLEPARFYANSLDHVVASFRSVLVALLLPHWRLRLSQRSLLRLPPKDVLSRKLLGGDRPQPWILNSGYAAAICIEGQAMKSHYGALGFIENKLHAIGSPRDDILWHKIQKNIDRNSRLVQELAIDPRLPTVLCSFPPDQYGPSGAVNAGFEFSSYDQLMLRWFEVLNGMVGAANIVVKPHPRLDVGRLVDFAGDGVRLSTVSTETLLPLADLYVASVSTTIRWALALGLPVINYDTYGYGYQDFRAAKGLVDVYRINDFRRELALFVSDQAAAAELHRRAEWDAQTWGRIDGQFGVRFAELAQSVVAGGASFTSVHHPGWKLPRQADAS